MMVTQRKLRCREVTGPTPHSVALFARPPNKKPPDHLAIEWRKKDAARAELEADNKFMKNFDLKNDWIANTDMKFKTKSLKQRVDNAMKQRELSVDERRERLRELLAHEDAEYLKEMESTQETVLERQASMREKAKLLKENREKERLEIVQTKLEQQWRSQCEDLRSTLTKRHQDQVAAERMGQLHMQAQITNQQKEEERMYAELWYADMHAKANREEQDAKKRLCKNLETVEVLNTQMAGTEAAFQEEMRMRDEAIALRLEEAELRKLEDLRDTEDKRRKQAETREYFTRSIQLKRRKQAREEQEQLAFDMKILEQLLEDSHNEAMEHAENKKEMAKENQLYRDYLAQLKSQEAEFERNVTKIIDAEVEKTWQKQLAKWKLEKKARQKMMEEVLDGRMKQLKYKQSLFEIKRASTAREKVEIKQYIEETQRADELQQIASTDKRQAYKSDLLAQMDYNHRQRVIDTKEKERQWSAQMDAEDEYRRKLEDALASDFLENVHPIRKYALNRIKNENKGGLVY